MAEKVWDPMGRPPSPKIGLVGTCTAAENNSSRHAGIYLREMPTKGSLNLLVLAREHQHKFVAVDAVYGRLKVQPDTRRELIMNSQHVHHFGHVIETLLKHSTSWQLSAHLGTGVPGVVVVVLLVDGARGQGRLVDAGHCPAGLHKPA